MKKLLLALPIFAISAAACSQDLSAAQVPSVVQNSLKLRFAEATHIDWEKKGAHYEAEFKLGQTEYEARISATGEMLGVKQDITAAELPAAVSNALATRYKNQKADDIDRVETDGKVYYQVELEKMLTDKKLVLHPDGQEAAKVAFWD